ncbi:MAG: carbamoyl-phosphate synthase small subunit [Candidatus Peregrinibacteria bacterium Gr01-1014_25]|nr:MAG: carbamoyl-phosphate synthase small subunit [Candidatus Peregrinibacteria bacterium Gr01-1014_25]
MASLALTDGTTFEGETFGAAVDTDGEVVFTTGMVGYPESLTDPSYRGQILVFTYPLIGNYGVPTQEKDGRGFAAFLESENIHVRGVIVAQASACHSHHASVSSLHNWLEHHGIPGITGIDTRALTKRLREHGVMLGRIRQETKATDETEETEDPNLRNLVAEVSCKEVMVYEPTEGEPIADAQSSRSPTVIAYDCGMKRNILRSLLERGMRVVRVPWNFDLDGYDGHIDGVFISNGPGDPKQCTPTIRAVQRALEKDIPTFGICLGNQLMALAIGGDTFKLKYGHRSANQPCVEAGSQRCIITSQNHGFAVKEELPKDWSVWFRNANDGTIEGIRHRNGRFFAVQFHPEAAPGPQDAAYLFDEFAAVMRQST